MTQPRRHPARQRGNPHLAGLPQIGEQHFQEPDGLARGIACVGELACREISRNFSRGETAGLYGHTSRRASKGTNPHECGLPPISIMFEHLERRAIGFPQVEAMVTERLVGKAVVQRPPARPDMLHLKLPAMEKSGEVNHLPGVGALAVAFLPQQPFLDVVARRLCNATLLEFLGCLFALLLTVPVALQVLGPLPRRFAYLARRFNPDTIWPTMHADKIVDHFAQFVLDTHHGRVAHRFLAVDLFLAVAGRGQSIHPAAGGLLPVREGAGTPAFFFRRCKQRTKDRTLLQARKELPEGVLRERLPSGCKCQRDEAFGLLLAKAEVYL